MKNYLVTLVVLVVLGSGAFLLLRDPAAPEQAAGTAGDTASVGSDESDEPAPSAITITYTNDGFDADAYEIAAGGTVTIVNNSSNPLEFSSDNHPTHTKNPELNTMALPSGQSTQLSVSQTGSWGVHDHLNAQHTATLIVR